MLIRNAQRVAAAAVVISIASANMPAQVGKKDGSGNRPSEPAPRVESGFEHFCNQAKIKSSRFSIIPNATGSGLNPINHDGDDLPGYQCVETIYAFGGHELKVISERLGVPNIQTWVFKGEGPGGSDATFEAHLVDWMHRVSIETPQGARRVLFSCYVRPLPAHLRIPKGEKEYGNHMPYSKAVFGQDSLPFDGESAENFIPKLNRDPLYRVYRGSVLSKDKENRPKRTPEDIFGACYDSYKVLGLLRDKPIVFSRKLLTGASQWDVKTKREVRPTANIDEFAQAMGEQVASTPIMAATYACSDGLSLWDYCKKYQVPWLGFDFTSRPAQKGKKTLDLFVEQPLLPWDTIMAGEHSDGVPFISCYDGDPLGSGLGIYVIQYRDEHFPRVAVVNRDIFGILSPSIESMDWYQFSPEVLMAAREAGKNIPTQAHVSTCILAAVESNSSLMDKRFVHLGSKLDPCFEKLEIDGTRTREKKEERILFPSINSVYK